MSVTKLPTQVVTTIGEAGLRIADELFTLYSSTPDSELIDKTMLTVEPFLLGYTPEINADAIPGSIKSFLASTLHTLVEREELDGRFALHFIGQLGLRDAVLANAADRTTR